MTWGFFRALIRFSPWVNTSTDEYSFSTELRTAVLGGIVGGVAFAAVNPVVAPAIIDTQVRTGIVDEPEPEIWIQEIENPGNTTLQSYGYNTSDDYSLYLVNISNDDNRPLYNYNVNLRFPGCVESGQIGLTNRGAAVITHDSESIQVGEFPNRPSNTTCYGAVEADQFDPGNAVIVTYIVDSTPEENFSNLYPRPTLSDTVLVTDSYTWNYNGRTYANQPKLQIYSEAEKKWVNSQSSD